MAATDLATAYIQLMPSFRGFESELVKEVNKSQAAMKQAGARAGADYAKGFLAETGKIQPNVGAASAGGGAAGASGAAAATAAATAAGVVAGEEIERDAGLAGQRAGAATATGFAAGISKNSAAITGAGFFLTKAVTLPLAAIGVGSAKAAISFESAFAGIRKTVDATEAQFGQLETQIRDLAKVIPITREELAFIGELGGQFGLQVDGILPFIDVVAKLGVATNLSSEAAGTFIARFSNIVGIPTDEFDILGSVITELGNNSAATEADITSMALRLAGAGKLVGLTSDEILGISSALASVGVRAEAGGTAFSRTFKIIDAAVRAGGTELATFAEVATGTTGSAEAFAKAWGEDTAGAIATFIDGLGRIINEGGDAQAKLDEIGLADIRIADANLRLGSAYGLTAKQLKLASDEQVRNTALNEEAGKRFATTESQLTTLANNLTDVAVTIGDSLLPTILEVADAAMPLIETIADIAEGFAKLPDPVKQGLVSIGLIAALAGPTTAALGGLGRGVGDLKTSLGGLRGDANNAASGVNGLAVAGRGLKGVLKGGIGLAVAFGVGELVGSYLDDATGRTERLTGAVSRLKEALADGKPAVDDFFDLATKGNDQIGNPLIAPYTVIVGLTQNVLKGQVELADGTTRNFRLIEDAIKQAADGGKESLDELARQFVEERNSLDESSQAYEDYGRILDSIAAKRAEAFGSPRDGKAAGALIAAAGSAPPNPLDNLIPEGLRDFVGQAREGAEGADVFATALTKLDKASQLSSLGIDAAAVAADSFRAASAQATRGAAALSAAFTVGSSFRDLKIGLGVEVGEDGRKDAARKVAQETDRIATEQRKAITSTDGFKGSLDRLNPALARAEIELGALGAASSAFSKAIEQSTTFDDQIGSALNLGEAFTDFRRTIRRLPTELDVTGLSLQKLRPRTREAIRNVLSLGEASKDYLATLLETGESSGKVRGEADRLRGAFADQLRQAGLTEDQIAKYIETMGLTPTAVETAIRLSGEEEARFKLTAYADLLNDRIPSEVASSVIARIEAGDLEGAGKQLAAFAATNPVTLQLDSSFDDSAVTVAQDQLDELERKTLALPRSIDFGKALFGGYTEAEQRGVEQLLSGAQAANELLATLVGNGQGEDAIRIGGEIRNQFGAVMAEELDISITAADELLDQVGFLDESEVRLLVDKSQIDEAIFTLQFLYDFLDQGAGLPDALDKEVSLKIAQGDIAGASQLLRDFVNLTEGFKFTENEALIALRIDTALADAGFGEWITGIESTVGDTNLGVDTTLAELGFGAWITGVEGSRTDAPLGVDDDDAERGFGAWVTGIEGSQTDAPLGADTNLAEDAVGRFGDWLADLPPFGVDVDVNFAFPDTSLLGLIERQTNRPFTLPGRADGGIIEGPGSGTSDSILAALSDGEYVIKAKSVQNIGIGTLESINKTGRLPTFATGGMVGSVPQVQMPDGPGAGSPRYEYTVVEAQKVPKPEDAFRVWESEEFLAGFNR